MVSTLQTEKLEARWANLFRTQPDPSAPNAVSSAVHAVLCTLAYIPYVLFNIVYVPFLTIKYVSSARPFPTWTYGRMMRNRLNKLYQILIFPILDPPQTDPYRRAEDHPGYKEAEDKGEINVQIIRLKPADERMRVGVAASRFVRGEESPGVWVTPRNAKGKGDESAQVGEKVILHIHGGAYIVGHPLWNALPLEVVRSTQQRLLSINYRKPTSASRAFPGPLLDALSAYVHLTQDLHFPASDIIFLGESAGGHLALMLSRYLHDVALAQPASIVMMAPWCDLALSGPSYTRHAGVDTLTAPRLKTSVRSAMRYYKPEAMSDPYFCPANAGKAGWEYLREAGVKVYMMVGTRECFEDEIRVTAGAMKEAGVHVMLREDVDGLHTGALFDPKAMAVFVKDVQGFVT